MKYITIFVLCFNTCFAQVHKGVKGEILIDSGVKEWLKYTGDTLAGKGVTKLQYDTIRVAMLLGDTSEKYGGMSGILWQQIGYLAIDNGDTTYLDIHRKRLKYYVWGWVIKNNKKQ